MWHYRGVIACAVLDEADRDGARSAPLIEIRKERSNVTGICLSRSEWRSLKTASSVWCGALHPNDDIVLAVPGTGRSEAEGMSRFTRCPRRLHTPVRRVRSACELLQHADA